ncbi:hypothetical protein [Prosthecomicrobium hirschii]|uniref:hypothetical protein n=1 Tax=Prosthecodimorpha hirschii TaxID=665126 RepID=UPI00221E4254|nr:hypothetical protein [Prosthecomicrobium hirschii]MCW1840444.1 hypothetical protein [Prosthecomicrobium hirschii]
MTMKNNGTRATVAAICAAVVNRRGYSYVHDFTANSSRHVTIKVNDNKVDAYDYAASASIDGSVPGDLYHYGENTHIEMKISNNKVEGFHYGSSDFYEATVSGTSVEFYDFGTSNFYFYEVS